MPRCHAVSAARAAVGILTLGLAALTQFAALTQVARADAVEWQSPESVRAAARDFVARTAGPGVRVEVVAVDDRLKLPACSEPLTAAAQSALRMGQGTVAVSCNGASPWRLFVPVRTVSDVGAVVLTRAVAAGERLEPADLAVETRPSGTLPYQYFTEPGQAIGLAVRRTLSAGTVLVPAAVDRPDLVERGALVTLVSRSTAVQVRIEGVALEAGSVNQRVRVRSPSGRVVEGTVTAAGEVEVGP